MRCTDRPGRYAAIFVVCPLLLYGAYRIRQCDVYVACGIAVFAVILCAYESFWISLRRDEAVYISTIDSVPEV